MRKRFFQKPISCELSPNMRWPQIFLILNYLFNPKFFGHWKKGEKIKLLENAFKDKFNSLAAFSFDSGRTALGVILQALELKNGDEVALQAFTCVVVPNSIKAAYGLPVYLDIDKSYNLDVQKLEETLQTHHNLKAVIVQHTFGLVAEIEKISQLCKKHHLYLIEDCAHALGATYDNKLVGTFGDAAMFSFGRDKVISAISGGLVIINNPQLTAKIEKIYKNTKHHSVFWIWQHLNHPLFFSIGKWLYYFFSLGKIIIELSKKLKLWPLVLQKQEKQGQAPQAYLLPNVLADLAWEQFINLEKLNLHRKSLAKSYLFALSRLAGIKLPKILQNSRPIFLRFSFTLENREKVVKHARQAGLFLGNWYHQVIDPSGSVKAMVNYKDGSCPRAEKIAEKIVNLPTHINISNRELKKVINFFQEEIKS